VVIPVFNGERHLRACISSILDQTYSNIEVVVADQASTDRSLEIIESFGDPRIRILPEPTEQLDLHSNWARGISAATGELVKLVCHDDVLLPNCLSAQVELLNRYPSAVLACARRRIIDGQDNVLLRARGLGSLVKNQTRLIGGHALAHACTRAGANLLGEPASVLIRRSALPEPLFDPQWRYSIDVEFYFRCLEEDEAILDSRVLCCFRVSPQQLSAVLAKGQAKELHALFAELARRYPDEISKTDVWIGTRRAQLLARARRTLYWQMRLRSTLVAKHRAAPDPSLVRG
jgi:glycosyltransferase involved in cell wall biosynthesis